MYRERGRENKWREIKFIYNAIYTYILYIHIHIVYTYMYIYIYIYEDVHQTLFFWAQLSTTSWSSMTFNHYAMCCFLFQST